MSHNAFVREDTLSRFKARLRSSGHLSGLQHNSGSEAVLELMAFARFDFVILDMEHSSYGFAEVERLTRVADGCRIVPFVRVNHNDPHLIGRALDAGAAGIVVPHVASAQDCHAALAAMRYPPLGRRGKTAGCRAARWGMAEWSPYERWANAEPMLVPLIESAAGVNALREIAAVPGLGFIFIGPGDLSHSYGHPGLGLRAEPVMRAVRDAVAIAAAHGLAVCTVPVPGMDPELVTTLLDMGVRVMMWGVDLVLIGAHFRSVAELIADAEHPCGEPHRPLGQQRK